MFPQTPSHPHISPRHNTPFTGNKSGSEWKYPIYPVHESSLQRASL